MEERKKLFYGWRVVAGCAVVTCTVVPLVMALSNKFLLPVTAEMGISRSAFTLSNTILQALGIVLSPVVAKKMAGGNLRKLMSASIAGFALSYASFSLADNAWRLYASGFAAGLFFPGATIIPVSIVITNWFTEKRGLAMSLAMAGIGVGGFFLSPLVTWLLGEYGWRAAYRAMALVVLVTALPAALFLLRNKPEDMGLVPYGAGETRPGSDAGRRGVSLSVAASRGKPFFLLMLGGMFLTGFVNSGALGQFPPALQEMRGAATQAALISLYSLIGVFGKLLLGWLNDRFGLTVSALFGCTAFALVFVCMLLGGNLFMLYAMTLFFGLGMGIGNVTPPLVVAGIFGGGKYGEAYGIANSAVQIGLSTGSLAVAALYDAAGSYDAAWLLLFVLSCLTFVCWAGALAASRRYRQGVFFAAQDTFR